MNPVNPRRSLQSLRSFANAPRVAPDERSDPAAPLLSRELMERPVITSDGGTMFRWVRRGGGRRCLDWLNPTELNEKELKPASLRRAGSSWLKPRPSNLKAFGCTELLRHAWHGEVMESLWSCVGRGLGSYSSQVARLHHLGVPSAPPGRDRKSRGMPCVWGVNLVALSSVVVAS